MHESIFSITNPSAVVAKDKQCDIRTKYRGSIHASGRHALLRHNIIICVMLTVVTVLLVNTVSV